MATHREIVEHDDFKAARRALDIDVRLLDEIMEGVVDVIARIPETFGRVEYTNRLRVVAPRISPASTEAIRSATLGPI
jgi:hypothetical protein